MFNNFNILAEQDYAPDLEQPSIDSNSNLYATFGS